MAQSLASTIVMSTSEVPQEEQVVMMKYIKPRRLVRYLEDRFGPGNYKVTVCSAYPARNEAKLSGVHARLGSRIMAYPI